MLRTALTDQQHDRFVSDGFVIIEHLFERSEVEQIRDTFMAMNRDGPVAGLSEVRRGRVDGTVGGYDTRDPLAFYPRMMHPHKHADKPVGPLAMTYMTHPRLKPILSELVGEEPYAVQTMFYFKPPGARGQALHQDNFYLKVKPGTCMAAWIAIDDADEENGGMMCVPNTHLLEIACPEKADPALYFTTEHVEPPAGLRPRQLRLKAGDVLFFNGNVIHGSPPNTSRDRFRRSLICHYVPASTAELSSFYEVYNFAGERQHVLTNNDGGPCGTSQDIASGPH
jgi:ectoine hydroxylase-related dioxygenase (phytanoyl-CoA dioxygenase family)